ncbi:hypothetical protein E1B28_009815 [Marasmius oreades]|uniref:Autophagy-related protein 14 n=1 Tax=Marasmius oreades TaxID=181124 RepID=A0A9P7UQV2_9AGAR|nr:uncharacterized protein E1B28_009815 [Marasmius oreades]KAG7090723.1 hypothetical protein E1B28_009815 [Marasmius oreades]
MTPDQQVVERRIRHVASIQVCNLTPFPLRDAFASALSKPTEHSQFATHGHLPDDLDATLSRKRGRRISSNSTTTLRSLHSDEGRSVRDTSPSDTKARKRTTSSTSGNRQTAVRSQRARTTSISSVHNLSASSFPDPYSHEPSKALPSTSSDNSQLGLERVLRDRLVETFLAIYVPLGLENAEAEPPEWTNTHTPSTSQQSFPSPHMPSHKAPVRRLETNSKESQFPSTPDRSPSISRRESLSGTLKSRTLSNTRSGNAQHKRASSIHSPIPPSRRQGPSTSRVTDSSTIPDYMSSIHRPSTNPSFCVDPRSEFAPGTDLSQHVFKVELWAKTGTGVDDRDNLCIVNGKGKEKEISRTVDNEWQILEHWTVDLSDLHPLSEDPNDTLHLPSNTLILGLHSPAKRFYVAPHNLIRTRTPSPSGYASDPETNARKVKEVCDSSPELALPSRRIRRGARQHSEDTAVKTSSWQDLFKLVSLQTCIADTEASFTTIAEGVNTSIMENSISMLRRELSQRESQMTELKVNYITVSQSSQKIRDDMRVRHEQLKHRREMLLLARTQEDELTKDSEETKEEVVDERSRYNSLRTVFRPARAVLISTLASIFPIELFSPPDLLYTILDVPLPIPLSATDPAPPSFLPNHKGINEETVATALGYAALLVHLLATYLGKGLVYPVTYIGSRSLIRDGISAMVGPRMFPLFSKGVDAYRYEYGVFLLNKDIELIMADFDLRAIDIRHTLPNLKNLLLTLTDGASVPAAPPRSRLSPVACLTEQEFTTSSSDVDEEAEEPSSPAPTVTNNTTPKANSHLDLPSSELNNITTTNHVPAAGGSTSPTTHHTSLESLDTAKKSSSRFLGLSSPLAGFLRARYPSSLLPTTPAAKDGMNTGDTNTVNVESEPTSTPSDGNTSAEGGHSNGDMNGEIFDRRAIRGDTQSVEGVDHVRESKSTIGNGHLDTDSVEKHHPDRGPTHTPPRIAHVSE